MTEQRDATALATQGLAVGYDGVPLVSGIELAVASKGIVTLIGPNGAGKSTLLKTVAGQLAPVGGAVWISGKPLEHLNAHERALELSVMLTDRLKTELLTCADVVEMGRYPHTGRMGIATETDRAKMREAMEMTRVWDLRGRDFMQLSDGQRQRVLLARAICQEPHLLVLDEPTSYLDIHYQIELLAVLRELVETRDVGVFMSLHELPLAWKVSDWVVCMKGGTITAQGAPREICTPEVIDALFDLDPGTFDPLTGMIDLQKYAY